MERFEIFTGENLSQDMYLTTWELDNNTFEDKDKISKDVALMYFEASQKSTIVLWDNIENKLVGYLTPFLLNHKFACKYIVNNKTYQESITRNVFEIAKKGVNGDIYIFSTVIVPEYRDKKLELSIGSKTTSKSAFKILNEALVDWICYIKEQGVSINYVFAEKVSSDGEKYLRSLHMQPCLATQDDCKFAKLFSPDMFNKCSNVKKLYDLYDDDKYCIPYDNKLLDGHEYLSIRDNKLYYKDINLYDLVKKYKAPLEVAYTPMIADKIKYLKNLFNEKIAKYDYPASYNYAYATKANYYSEVILTALNHVDMLETSSAYDIDIILRLVSLGYIKKGYRVLCNGFKNEKYISTLKQLLDKGIDVVPIIENEQEFEMLESLGNYNINVGIRYNSDFESRIIKNEFAKDDEYDNRFGFDKDDYMVMANKIKKSKHLNFIVMHFHFGGSITNIDNFIKGYSNIVDFYCQLRKSHKELSYLDFGGGFPVKYSLTYSFDYDKLVDKMIKSTMEVCSNYKTPCPNLIGEHGRFTTADHSFYIYKIDFSKKVLDTNWYIINGSLMNMAPDIWGIQQDFTILPVNLYENKCIPVCLGGETCDPDDRYYLSDNNVKLFMPKINDGEELYIAIFSIGAYQEIISGIGGVHHCLIPEGNELVIYKDKKGKLGYCTMNQVTDSESVFEILDYDDTSYMDKFVEKSKD